jgi:hypothetical protein
MKYFHGQLEERNGEQEYTYDYLIKATSLEKAKERLILEAEQFYGSDAEKIDDGNDGFFFFGGAIYVEVKSIGQTTKAQFIKNILHRYGITA